MSSQHQRLSQATGLKFAAENLKAPPEGLWLGGQKLVRLGPWIGRAPYKLRGPFMEMGQKIFWDYLGMISNCVFTGGKEPWGKTQQLNWISHSGHGMPMLQHSGHRHRCPVGSVISGLRKYKITRTDKEYQVGDQTCLGRRVELLQFHPFSTGLMKISK